MMTGDVIVNLGPEVSPRDSTVELRAEIAQLRLDLANLELKIETQNAVISMILKFMPKEK